MAYEFDGINDYIVVQDHPLLDITGGVTVSLWLKPTAQTADRKTVLEKSGPIGWARYGLWCGTTETATFGVQTASNPRVYCGFPLPVGEWTHLAGTYDQQYLRFYVNGRLVGQIWHTGPISVSEEGLYIGGDAFYDMEFFTGVIDEVRIYDGPLTAEEILALSRDGGGQR
ncbi:LamG domain-containing protein [Gemmatimonadota bacterium]